MQSLYEVRLFAANSSFTMQSHQKCKWIAAWLLWLIYLKPSIFRNDYLIQLILCGCHAFPNFTSRNSAARPVICFNRNISSRSIPKCLDIHASDRPISWSSLMILLIRSTSWLPRALLCWLCSPSVQKVAFLWRTPASCHAPARKYPDIFPSRYTCGSRPQ